MSDPNDNNQFGSPEALLLGIGDTLEHYLDVQINLGAVATGSEVEAQQSPQLIKDAVERIQHALATIVEYASQQPGLAEAQEVGADMALATACEPADPAENDIIEPTAGQKLQISLELNLTADEEEKLRKTADILSSVDTMMHIRDIFVATFGKRRLKKDTEQRFIAILDSYVHAGAFNYAEYSYGYARPKTDQSEAAVPSEATHADEQPQGQVTDDGDVTLIPAVTPRVLKRRTPDRSIKRFYDTDVDTGDPLIGRAQEEVLPAAAGSVEVARFIQKLLTHVTKMRTEPKGRGIRWTKIAESYAHYLGIPMPDAKKLVRSLEEAELLFGAGAKHGVRLLTTDPEKAIQVPDDDISPLPEQLSGKQKEVARIRELKIKHGPSLLLFLDSILDTEQTEFKTTISDGIDGVIAVDDINAVCRLLHQDGLVFPKQMKGRGVSRARKGTTWGLTGMGRNAANQIRPPGQLSAAAKKALSKIVG